MRRGPATEAQALYIDLDCGRCDRFARLNDPPACSS